MNISPVSRVVPRRSNRRPPTKKEVEEAIARFREHGGIIIKLPDQVGFERNDAVRESQMKRGYLVPLEAECLF